MCGSKIKIGTQPTGTTGPFALRQINRDIFPVLVVGLPHTSCIFNAVPAPS